MPQNFAIWSPVIIARLESPRRIRKSKSISIDFSCNSIEELKVIIKESSAIHQGQAIETTIKIGMVFLLEDASGYRQLISREDVVVDRVALESLDKKIGFDRNLSYIIEVQKTFSEGEINGYELKCNLYIDYMLIITREQVVQIAIMENPDRQIHESRTFVKVIEEMENEIIRLQDDNQELRQKIFLQEKNILSLKKAVSKAEYKSNLLRQQNLSKQEIIAGLRQSMEKQEARVYNYRTDTYEPLETISRQAGETMGARIKRMFLNN